MALRIYLLFPIQLPLKTPEPYPSSDFKIRTSAHRKDEQLDGVLYREKQDIEGVQGMVQIRRAHHQTAISIVFKPRSDMS